MHFFERLLIVWFKILLKPIPKAPNNIGSGHGLVPLWYQAIIWTNIPLIHWLIHHELPSLNELTLFYINGLDEDCGNSIADAMELHGVTTVLL